MEKLPSIPLSLRERVAEGRVRELLLREMVAHRDALTPDPLPEGEGEILSFPRSSVGTEG